MTYLAPSATRTSRTARTVPDRALSPGALLAVVLGLLVLAASLAGAVGATEVVLALGAGLAGWLTLASTTGSGM